LDLPMGDSTQTDLKDSAFRDFESAENCTLFVRGMDAIRVEQVITTLKYRDRRGVHRFALPEPFTRWLTASS